MKKEIYEKEIKQPTTRLKQFFYLYKENFLLLFYVGIFFSFFLLPTLFVAMNLYLNYYEQITNEIIQKEELLQTILSGGVLFLFTLPFLGIGYSGVFYISIKLIFNEGATFKDFFIGIKKNIFLFLILYFIEGILLFFLLLNSYAYYFLPINPYIKLFSLIISVLFLIVYLLIRSFIIIQTLLFNNKKIQIIKNSFIFMISRLFPSILIFIMTHFFYFLLLVLIGVPLIFDMIFILLFQGTYQTFIESLFVIDTIERYIDPKLYPDLYHKGLLIRNDDE